MKPAYGYLRVSGLSQADEKRDGLVRQEQAIRAFAKANGYTIMKIYRDAHTGAKELEGRAAYHNMMADLRDLQTKCVIIERLDRLARSLLIQESIIADFQRHSYEIMSTCEPNLCSDDPTRIAFRQMLGVFAQYERSMLVLKLRGARERMKADPVRFPNYREGKPKFGQMTGGVLDIPTQQEIIKLVCSLRAEGKTLLAIAKTLTDRGYRPLQKNTLQWRASTIRQILLAQRPPKAQSLILEPPRGQSEAV